MDSSAKDEPGAPTRRAAPGNATMAWAQVMLDQRRERKRGGAAQAGLDNAPTGRAGALGARAVVIGLSLSILTGIGLAAMFASRAILPHKPAPASIRWQVRSQPSGAQVLGDRGAVLGTTPWQAERPAGAGALEIVLQKDGFLDRPVSLSLQHGGEVDERLAAAPQRAAEQSPQDVTQAPPREQRHRTHRRHR